MKVETKAYYIWSWTAHSALLLVLVSNMPAWGKLPALFVLALVNAMDMHALWFNRNEVKKLRERRQA